MAKDGLSISMPNINETIRHVVRLSERKEKQVIMLCQYYAGVALQLFRARQANNEFWTNRTFTAMNTVFSGVTSPESKVTGFFIAHAVEYGPQLELANDGKHAALRPILNAVYSDFMKDLDYIWQDDRYKGGDK